MGPIRMSLKIILSFIMIIHCTSISSGEPFHKGEGKRHPPIYTASEQVNDDKQQEVVLEDQEEAKNEKRVQRQSSPSTTSEPKKTTTTPPPTTPTTKKTQTPKKIINTTPPTTTPTPSTTSFDDGEQEAAEASPQPVTAETPTTTSSITTTRSTRPTTTTTPRPVQPKKDELYCLCDIHRTRCDMNCCCDPDCSEEDRRFFSFCSQKAGVVNERSYPRRQRSCYKSFVTFTHYMEHEGVQNDNGMLCIVRDNNKADNILPAPKIEEIRRRIQDGIINIQAKYSLIPGAVPPIETESYKFGSPIIAGRVEEVSQEGKTKIVDFDPFLFGLPSSYAGSSCKMVREPIRFLEDSHSTCRSKIDFSQDCERISILNPKSLVDQIRILRNPAEEITEESFLEIKLYRICNGDFCSTKDQAIPNTRLNKQKRQCANVMVGLNLTFYIDLDGISHVLATLHVKDFAFTESQIQQDFRTNFIWKDPTKQNTTLLEAPFPRSGNPGYIVGKPVIMGEKVEVVEDEKSEEGSENIDDSEAMKQEKIRVWKDPSKWLTIHSAGKCSMNREIADRKSVLFGYSHMTLCSLNLTRFKTCGELQTQISRILFGIEDPMSFEKRKWNVASFGNADPETPSQWVPVTVKPFPVGPSSTPISRGCNAIVTYLRIVVTYAFVGSVDFPQAKITGVFYEPGEPISIDQDQLNKTFDVLTVVNFKDVTGPPIMRIARWPVISVTLPKDFFYPFSR